MRIEVTGLWLQNEEKRALAKVSFHDEINSPHSSGQAEVFIPLTGTIEEMKQAALDKAFAFLNEVLSPDATIIK
jgi:hypothetical protein